MAEKLATILGANLDEVTEIAEGELLEGEREEILVRKERIRKEYGVFYGGLDTVDVAALDPREVSALNACFNGYVDGLKKVSTKIAEEVAKQRFIVLAAAKIAKQVIRTRRDIMYPSQEGTIGVAPLIPAALKYVDSPTDDQPAWTSYNTDRWTMSLTADAPAYIFGNGTKYYSASPDEEKQAFLVILKNGIIEIGSTPTIDHFRLYSKIAAKYGITAPHIIVDVPLEDGKVMYQYNTWASVMVSHITPTMWGFMPHADGVRRIKLLGFVIYDHKFLPGLTKRKP